MAGAGIFGAKRRGIVRFRNRQLMHRCCLALLCLRSASDAQNPSSEQMPRIRSEVNEVLVPVVVTDGRGRHIGGLKASDFQIFEEGKPERIVALRAERMSATSSEPP